jgi:glycosyltransferase involved in cell wall biosynthesis
MENDIFVTFVVPVFNAELFLKSFFLSLSSQTYQKFQCLFVFDKGNDDTLEILKRMVESSSFPCQILEKPSKEGVGKARDYALDSGLISTKYIMFIDVDDQLDPSFLEKLVCKAESEKADMTICGCQKIDAKTNRVLANVMVNNPSSLTNFFDNNILLYINPAMWNKLLLFSLVGQIRFVYKGGGEDGMFLLKILPKCKKICFINEPLYKYLVHENSLITTTDETFLEMSKRMYLDTKKFYQIQGGEYQSFFCLLDSYAFLRLGIGETTRVCFNDWRSSLRITKSVKRFLDCYFPSWRDSPYLSFNRSRKYGIKGLLVWRCRLLYKINLFPLFFIDYFLFTKIFRKDVRW